MLKNTNRIRNVLLSIILSFFGSQSFTLPIIWYLDNVQFDDGGKLEGFFTLDWPPMPDIIPPLEDFRITASGGNEEVFPPVT